LKLFSDGADTTSFGRLFHKVATRKEKNDNLACEVVNNSVFSSACSH